MPTVEYKVTVRTRKDGKQTIEWRLGRKFHREGGPAIVYPDGREEWYIDGKLHREGGPAVITPDGREQWNLNGKLHREDGPALILSDREVWYLNGVVHREDGPAVTFSNGAKGWFRHGKYHREDGPAAILWNGDTHWYLDGNPFKEDEFHKEIARRRNIVQELTVAEIGNRLGHEIKVVKE